MFAWKSSNTARRPPTATHRACNSSMCPLTLQGNYQEILPTVGSALSRVASNMLRCLGRGQYAQSSASPGSIEALFKLYTDKLRTEIFPFQLPELTHLVWLPSSGCHSMMQRRLLPAYTPPPPPPPPPPGHSLIILTAHTLFLRELASNED